MAANKRLTQLPSTFFWLTIVTAVLAGVQVLTAILQIIKPMLSST